MSVSASSAGFRVVDDGLECSVAAYTTMDVPLESIPALRDTPGSASSPPLPPRFLRYADEQTVVGMVAVLRAMAMPRMFGTDFTQWGVLAAPRLLGRLGGAAALKKFAQLGPAAISPHLIPQNSLHALSSAISVALGMHGPNFGIGGGPEALDEGLLVAVTYLQGAGVPGMWLVLTEWDAEPIPDGRGGSSTSVNCRATALALVPRVQGGAYLRMSSSAGHRSRLSLTAWLAADARVGDTARWSRALSWGGQIEFVLGEQVEQRKAA
jgi:hypothetical protein